MTKTNGKTHFPARTKVKRLGDGLTRAVLSNYIGAISGSPEAFSDGSGQRFADLLIDKQQRARL